MRLSDLIVTQHALRHCETIPNMVDFVRKGNIWNKNALNVFAEAQKIKVSPLIQISRFEDGKLYVHDGHHRIVATFIGERYELGPDEYEITDWTYDEYLAINLKAGWYTPYDPRIEVRLPDLKAFKKAVIASNNPELFISNNRHVIVEPRKITTVRMLAEHVKAQIV